MWDAERLSLAKRHFGNPLRLQVAEWILAHGADTSFKQQEAVDGVRHVTKSASSVPKQLNLLVGDGMLQRFSTESGNVFYTFVDHPLWGAYRSLLEGLSQGTKDQHRSR